MVTIDTCPLCYSSEFEIIAEDGDKFTEEKVNICLNCGLVFLSPRMDSASDYYQEGGFDHDFREGAAEEAEKKTFNKMEKVWSTVKDFLPDGGSLLDIGCGLGAFIELASEKLDVMGIEPAPAWREWAQERHKTGDRIVGGTFPEVLGDDDTFDVISVFHVLEHVPDPRAFLTEIYNRLNDDGIFILEYPDIWKATGRPLLLWNYFQRSHLFDFSAPVLENLLVSIGFKPIQTITYANGFPLDKNVLVIFQKGVPEDPEWNSEFAELLRDTLKPRIQLFWHAKKPEIKIIHIASHGINVGDGAISAGIRGFAETATDAKIKWEAVDIVDMRYPNQYFGAELINETGADLIIVGGGGTIDGHRNRILTGTAFNMPIDELEKLQIPIAFCALGHNAFRGQPFYRAGQLQEFIDFCASNDIPFSVRRDGSLSRLKNIVDTMHITEVPDPGFFIRPEAKSHPGTILPEHKTLIFQVTIDANKHRIGDLDATKEFLGTIAGVMDGLMTDYQYNIVLALHTMDDIIPARFMYSAINPVNARYFLRTTVCNMFPGYASVFYNSYAAADLVVGMRGHSIICAAGMGIPFVALSTHDKVAGFAAEVGCSEYVVENGEDLETRLSDAIKAVLENPQKQRELVAINTETWTKELSDFMYRCLDQI